jgi:hypothetical protein
MLRAAAQGHIGPRRDYLRVLPARLCRRSHSDHHRPPV